MISSEKSLPSIQFNPTLMIAAMQQQTNGLFPQYAPRGQRRQQGYRYRQDAQRWLRQEQHRLQRQHRRRERNQQRYQRWQECMNQRQHLPYQ